MAENNESLPVDQSTIADADLCLRHISRKFARGLAKLAVRPGERIHHLDWGETQVAARERRFDRSLLVDLASSCRRVLHLEWYMRLTVRAVERTAEYHLLSVMLARQDARRRSGRKRNRWRHISVDSMVVVLGGRKKPWPRFGEYRTSRKGKRFSGVRFRIEAVYQQSVEQLTNKGSLFWFVFVPLAYDIDEPKLAQVLQQLRERVGPDEFVELITAMLSMAVLKKDRPELMAMIRSATQVEEKMRNPWLAEAEERGIERGKKLGLEIGEKRGLSFMLFLFERRLGRSLRERERTRIAARLAKEGHEKIGAVVLDLSTEALSEWLKPRKAQRTPST